MDFDLAIEVADETRDGGYNSQTARALILLADNARDALPVLNSVDSLLAEAGYSVDSSARHQLSIAMSMLRRGE